MVTGMIGGNMGIPITGINVSQSKEEKEEKVYNLAVETAEKLDIKENITREDIVCFDEYVGDGYSIPTNSMVEAVKLFARTEGILLDPVYSGKTAAGLIDLIRKDHFPKGSNILFLHTGGSPALYAYMDSFR
jgi:D-cysteine desulfhydrase